MRRSIEATFAFFAERFVICIVVSVLYIFVAAAVQATLVGWLGQSTFNYIIAGICSMGVAIPVCGYLGALLLIIVRCRHVCALAYMNRIESEKLSAYDVGGLVFKKHLTSFGLVYGIAFFVEKAGNKLDDSLWELLDGVPLADQLKRISSWGFVRRIAKGVLRTAFDAVVYYLVRYTNGGIGDDGIASAKALRKYLYSMPSLLKTSVPTFLLVYTLPYVLHWFAITLLIAGEGLVGGILLSVLIWPLFFVLRKVVCEPVMTVALLTAYGNSCEEDLPEDSKVKSVVDSILESAGLGDFDFEEEPKSSEPSATQQQEPMGAEQEEATTDLEQNEQDEMEAIFGEDNPDPTTEGMRAAMRSGFGVDSLFADEEDIKEYQGAMNASRLRVVNDDDATTLEEDEEPFNFVPPEGPRSTSSIFSKYFNTEDDEVAEAITAPIVSEKEWS